MEAASEATEIVTEDKETAKAAVEAVSVVEGDPTLSGNAARQEATAAAVAAVDALKEPLQLDSDAVVTAQSDATKAFQEAIDAKKSDLVAAEDAASAAIATAEGESSVA